MFAGLGRRPSVVIAFAASVAAVEPRPVASQYELPGGRSIDDKAPGGRPPASHVRLAVVDDETKTT